jgi:hypothetical protein
MYDPNQKGEEKLVKEFPFNGLLLRLEGALVEIDRKTSPFQMKRPPDKKEIPPIASEFGLRLVEIVDFAEKISREIDL